MLPDYAELHCLSNFSFQRGASTAEELVERAQQLGYKALAITDDCTLAGIVRAHDAAKEKGLPLIIGSEFCLDDGLRVVLLAPDREAYGDLAQLITQARQNASKGSYQLCRADVAALAGRLLALWLPPPIAMLSDARWFTTHFPDRAWLAVELFQQADDAERLVTLQALAVQAGLRCVAAGNVHMHVRSRRMLQDALTAIRLGRPVASCGFALFANGERHLRPRGMLAPLYPPALLAETLHIAQRCRFSLDSLRYEYPLELVPDGHSPDSYLAALTEIGLQQRYPDGAPVTVVAQVQKELRLIAQMDYAAFFLTVEDTVRFARSQGILCQGRGSAANSVVCYVLGITEISPEQSNLLFERFISTERNEPPDIDVDFEHERREVIIQYLYRKYGRDRAALAAAVVTYRTKSAMRDIGRALGFDEEQLSRLSELLAWWDKPGDLPIRLAEAGFDPNTHQVQRLLKLVQQLRRFPRHLSQHVGGFVLSRGPLARLVPIENASMPDRTVIQWDKDDLESLGLLKVDVLALGMLTALRRTLDLVSARQGRPMTLADIPDKDIATYDMICKADTVGVFQVESRAQMAMLPRLRPRCFYDLVVQIAIVRPGPIQGGMVAPYLHRRFSNEPLDDTYSALQAVLSRTCGVPIFQEQVMQLAVVAAGFTPGQADQLRRSMAAWQRTGKLGGYQQKLIEGMLARGYPLAFAEQIWAQIEGFASYGFPESHSASFALLVYASAWLKCHQPAAFVSHPMGFYSVSQLIQDALRHEVVFHPLDVQRSGWDCSLEETGQPQPAVRLGLRLIQGLASDKGIAIVARRPAGGYANLQDLQRRTGLDRRSLQRLADADALMAFSNNRREGRWQAGGLGLMDDLAGNAMPALDTPPPLPLALPAEEVLSDYQHLGLSLRDHPLVFLRPALRQEKLLSAVEIMACAHRQPARACGIVVGRQRPGTATGIVFLTLEDETGNVSVIVRHDLVERQRKELLGAQLLAVYGVVQREGDVVHLLAKRLADKSAMLGALVVESRDFH
ncbi:error-prone DNA polymerase [Chitinimonas sp. BJB300]|uniref:error-prone DNA polymerase n=1 Tax=Chitinimonas sp. BJB300 TaxID=1559339 RepID=UPI000C0EDCD6|nr:error-prone DNA polymerase [Chitinimonas sp. BJB300]PHV10434.1 error-prone DNA polymerase [Chitinimonas sp. BJB300]TSJ83267.1 error-prone DNA polymerase [Chitinimonas sp. BJB300]